MHQKDPLDHEEKVEVKHSVNDVSNTALHCERKLRLKIDLMVVPTVTLLYLLCFIDRTNIGRF